MAPIQNHLCQPRKFCCQFKRTLLVSGLVMVLLAFVAQLYFGQQRARQSHLNTLNQVIDARLDYLRNALWNLDEMAIQEEIQALAALKGITRAELKPAIGSQLHSGEPTRVQLSLISRQIYQPADPPVLLGTLNLYLDQPINWPALLSETLQMTAWQLLQMLVLVVLAHYLMQTLLLPRTRENIARIQAFYQPSSNHDADLAQQATLQDAFDVLDNSVLQAGHHITLERALHSKAEAESAAQRIEATEEFAKRTGEAHYLAGLLKQICRISTEFLTLPHDKMDKALRDALYEISLFLGLETSFVVTFNEQDSAEIRSFWRKESLPVAPIDVFLSRQREAYAASFSLLGPETLIQLNGSKLPVECVERQLIDWLQMESLILLRLASPERTMGLLFAGMLNSRGKLSDIECRLLGMTSNIIANLLIHREEQNNTKRVEAELHTVRMQLAALIQHDKLTDLPNAQAFHQLLEYELRRAQRNETPLSVLFLSIDKYAEYCAQHGPQACEQQLLRVAEQIRDMNKHASEMGAYLEKQCFALILPETPADHALYLAQRLLASSQVPVKSKQAKFSTSIALLRYSSVPSTDSAKVLQHAMQLLRAVQLNGGGHIEIYDAPAPDHPRLNA